MAIQMYVRVLSVHVWHSEHAWYEKYWFGLCRGCVTSTLDQKKSLKNQQKEKDKADEITKEFPLTVSHYACGSLFASLFVITFLIIVSIVVFSVFMG